MAIVVGILDNIRSVHNVGSMFRTADGAGISKLYLCGITPSPLDRFGKVRQEFGKVALGAEKTVAWESCASTARLIAKLKKEGFFVIAVEQDPRSAPYTAIPYQNREKVAFIMGTEVTGIEKRLLDRADCIAELPMAGNKESLNVGVVFGIIAYKIREDLTR